MRAAYDDFDRGRKDSSQSMSFLRRREHEVRKEVEDAKFEVHISTLRKELRQALAPLEAGQKELLELARWMTGTLGRLQEQQQQQQQQQFMGMPYMGSHSRTRHTRSTHQCRARSHQPRHRSRIRIHTDTRPRNPDNQCVHRV